MELQVNKSKVYGGSERGEKREKRKEMGQAIKEWRAG